ncbi:hypothetical protein N8974_00635 [bacterium]|nr:hypothetical protein [bacterium]
MADELIIISVVLATYFLGKIYIFVWSRKNSLVNTPSGFGVLLPLYLLLFLMLTSQVSLVSLLSILIISSFGFVYWVDDVIQLSPKIRIFIAFSAGATLFLVASSAASYTPFEIFCSTIMFGIASTVLTNVANFYDGEDLNLATIIFLAGLVLIFSSNGSVSELASIGPIMTGFAIGFGLINRIPLSLYLGDSGAFVLASIFIFLFINYVLKLNSAPEELMLVVALPIFDTIYVFMIRLYCKHDILSRNYLHLYQRIRIRFGGFYYLIPQFLNFCGLLFLAGLIESESVPRVWALIISTFTLTPIFYLVCRYLLVERTYFFGDGEAN